MYCTNCGTKLDSNSKFCPNCGSKVGLSYSNEYQQSHTSFQRHENSITYSSSIQKNPWELYIDSWKHIFDYQGVTSRRGFWWFYLFNVISIVILHLFLMVLYADETVLEQLLLGVLYLQLLSASARRMRDVNRSIYWGVIPFALQWLFQPIMVGYYVSTVLQSIIFIFFIVFLVFACQPSSSNKNRTRVN
ncbi:MULTISPECIES: DUF805 domain-containing protein [Staphylococcus]|uniref:Zinc-ribbon domain-containing protein n=1 Tax=Staphylococcus ureilyticus TaxID=94138 RepID=A0AB34AHS1_STAUR|nr:MULTISPECIES: DUF805 domain-containing protein [Staphylococcus]MBL0375692.1 DUF805 domain-containing protein [Staphylococcus sp. S75]MBL0383471.1 DUF805 domain-containing protein [Staphylococcus sp. S59]MBL0402075.1 DUF805 domain-containing protein [Staphylococcus sp. S36]QKU18251.1 DUF805 domain-containing protein [Staphylococcus cohnii]MCT1913144.1 DUF805 domain-containing protein [Staphylococcus ureilyticus]